MSALGVAAFLAVCFVFGVWREWRAWKREQAAVARLQAQVRIATREHEDELQRIWTGRPLR